MTADFQERPLATRQLPDEADTLAPDGAEVRILCSLAGGSAAHFRLAPGRVSRAGRHRSVEEIWYILEGRGEMWRRTDKQEDVVALTPGLCLTIPLGTSFQFRAGHGTALSAFAVTMPPWPEDSDDEWTEVEPHWQVRL
ncbi:MAG: cupin domain-containing protein [bacterium]|nr:cupin domain-containing protein [bacterium]